MSEAHEAAVKLLAIIIALVSLWAVRHSTWIQIGRRRSIALTCLVGLGIVSYVNFGRFHTDGNLLNLGDEYHYVIGSKYFPELGYDGLYIATVAAFEEKDPHFVPPQRMRDPKTDQIVATGSLNDLKREVRTRFSDARWTAFRADATHFYFSSEIFLDNGYLSTPAHVAIERLFTGYLPFRQLTAAFFAALDFLLLAIAGLIIYRFFGIETLAAAALVLGLGFCSRYYYVGGAFLRHDWLVALVICAAALARSHGKTAGAALAFAACTRVYPVLMLLPLAVFALSQRRQGKDFPASQFATGFIAISLALGVAGCLAGRGAGAWLESGRRLLEHGDVMAPISIGLRIPLSVSLANLRGDLVDATTLYAYSDISRDFAQTAHNHLRLIVVSILGVVTLSLRMAWIARDSVAAFVIGVVVMYTLTTPMCYYGIYFVLLTLVRPLRSAGILLIANALMYASAGVVLWIAAHGFIRLNGAAVYAPVSVFLLAASIVWLFGIPTIWKPRYPCKI
jgi:hypothetical protein